jgi:hypothetical protein
MNRSVLFFTLAVVGLSIARESQAAIIHESASLGPTGRPGIGLSLGDIQYLGSRFSVDSVVEVESVGGHIQGSGTAFAAIVSLSSPTALPSGHPFDMTTIATTVFPYPDPSDDILVPMSATLSPGSYALIIGSGVFGADGDGTMPGNNVEIPGAASYVIFNHFDPELNWHEFMNPYDDNLRFVVTGRVIPEPSSVALFWLGSLGACGFYRRHCKTTSH